MDLGDLPYPARIRSQHAITPRNDLLFRSSTISLFWECYVERNQIKERHSGSPIIGRRAYEIQGDRHLIEMPHEGCQIST